MKKIIEERTLKAIYLSLEYEIMCFFSLSLSFIALMCNNSYSIFFWLLFLTMTICLQLEYLYRRKKNKFDDIL